MLNKSTLIVSMVLIGCGGSSFEPSFNPSSGLETDSGIDAAGGAATVDSDSGVGAGGKVEHAHGGEGSGGRGAGGAQGSGGVGTGGAHDSTGGALSATGGTQGNGGAGTGGTPPEKDGGCALVTHDNGLGQTWQDCVALGTYDQAQAMAACKASGATKCSVVPACGPSLPEVRGYNADNSTGGRWGYVGSLAGYVGTGTSGELCFGAGDPNNHKWD